MRAAFLLMLSAVSMLRAAETEPPKGGAADRVVFVCEHGNVKSLIARELLNRMAGERGLALRAVSRGLTPGATIPPGIAEGMQRDGFDLRGFEARAFTAADLAVAARIVAIGVDTSSLGGRANLPIDKWEGIPPATEDYAASRDALRGRIKALLEALESRGRMP